MIVKALSIRQPWAWAILHADKRVENREWQGGCGYRGPLLLHASKGCTRYEYECAAGAIAYARDDLGLPPIAVPALADLHRGGLVGLAWVANARLNPLDAMGYEIGGCLGLVLEDVEALPFAEMKGALGLFGVDLFDGGLAAYRGAAENLVARRRAARGQVEQEFPEVPRG